MRVAVRLKRVAVRKLGIVFTLVVMWGALTLSPIAQSGLTITAPANGVRLAAGPDYATDVLGDPWDMSNPEDIGNGSERAAWLGIGLRGGQRHRGRHNGETSNGNVDTNLPFLYRGFHNIVNPGRTGKRYPINSSFYKKVAYRMYSAIAGQSPQAYWFHFPWDHPSGIGFGVRFLPQTQAGYKIYAANLHESLAQGSAWTNGSVVGFRLDPNSNQAGHVVRYDWVRVTRADAETTAIMPVQWSGGSGNTAIDVVDASGSVLNVASVSGASYSFNYGVLPPGAYTLRLTRGGSQATRSFSVNHPPLVKVTDPDETGGTNDYATTVLNNAWDMNGASDVIATRNVSGASYSGGAFHGTNSNGDANVFLLNPSNNQIPIDTTKYRYLTYRLRVDGTYNLGLGSVARVFWGSQTSSTAVDHHDHTGHHRLAGHQLVHHRSREPALRKRRRPGARRRAPALDGGAGPLVPPRPSRVRRGAGLPHRGRTPHCDGSELELVRHPVDGQRRGWRCRHARPLLRHQHEPQ